MTSWPEWRSGTRNSASSSTTVATASVSVSTIVTQIPRLAETASRYRSCGRHDTDKFLKTAIHSSLITYLVLGNVLIGT